MSPPGGPGERGWTDVRLDLNESAYAPLPSVAAAMRAAVLESHRYPEFRPEHTRAHIAAHVDVPAGAVTVGPGATGVALAVLQCAFRRALAAGTTTPALVTSTPTFDGYPILASMLGMRMDTVDLADDGTVDLDRVRAAITSDTAVVVICSPHNPTGSVVDEADLDRFLAEVPSHVLTVVDEAYVEFAEEPPDLRRLIRHRGVVVLRTFSKAYGLASLRVGYGIGPAEVIAALRGHEVPFAVGGIAMAAVPVALDAEDELAQRVRSMRIERDRMAGILGTIGCPVLPSHANFLFLPGPDGVAVGRMLRGCGVAVKQCGATGTRITVGDRAGTDRLVGALRLVSQSA
ncbi:aminotransferase class I/II-fold pyridoxal phosphate-dependent enzyme [Gordonia sp. zg691]|uniref:pyridoxal phosphate-dependent aminotransferase n=1 Tax=Gordonia jinghuaiqii TaxID=2758710 RepID=UPI0016624525|nr:aminotransferase class I/II-fold pyridoxal phosphate-dependent enzyme [Gordonia jinghuaiqii]MBD0862329.1 aminotransferase class I/II-fold pyridoxal phosphate-dependent enzyme [Gordonia jinghuaiqii]